MSLVKVTPHGGPGEEDHAERPPFPTRRHGDPEEQLPLLPAEDPPSSISAIPPQPAASSSPPSSPQCCPSAPGRLIAICCHGGAKMAALAYNLGKREINQHFTVRNAKILALGAVLLLSVCHAVSRGHSRGATTCDNLISSGRFLGENVWQPYSCMMHKYKTSEAKQCLANQQITFMGDSRIRDLYYAFVKILNPNVVKEKKHEDLPLFVDADAGLKVDFLWQPVVNNYMKQSFQAIMERESKPQFIVTGSATWTIKLNNGSTKALAQYKVNLSDMALLYEKNTNSDIYWILQDSVYEPLLSETRKMITNKMIDAYNDVAVGILNRTSLKSKSKLRIFSVNKLISKDAMSKSEDGLHLPESINYINAMILINAYCNNIIKPIDGSCCQASSPLTIIQQLAACFFIICIIGYLFLALMQRSKQRKNKPCADIESGEERKPATATPAASNMEVLLASLCKLGLIMAYFYFCDRANLYMKENKFYTHSSFFIPIIYILVLGIFYNENTKETKLLNREQTDEWKGWMQLVILIYHFSGASSFLPVYMHVRVLVAAYLFQTGYGHFSYFWLKGDFGIYRISQVIFRLNFLVVVLCIVMDRPYQFYYFVPLVTFWFMVIYGSLAAWPQIIQKKANANYLWHFALMLKFAFLLLCICFLLYSQGTFEKVFSLWPISKLFELNGDVYEWWFRWKLDRYAVFHGMLFAFIYLALQKRQVLTEGKGEPLFTNKVSNILLFFSVVSFLTYSIWASSCKNKTECNEMHPSISVVQIFAFVLIRNIPGYARSVYSSFFAWFGKISLELFICQYHIWLAADTKGILVLIPGSPMLNIIVSTFIFVCAAHEISNITNNLAQILVPKDNSALLKMLLCLAAFLFGLLFLSAVQ
ncbi:CAS1 domain-containing 1 isoform X1 [Pelobates cultripes]|uniref:CAS1 domain-containing 1 isoform X1 n=2 Tax=Pelobates cultripes TaxID=61616 RepID=A0AAD1W1D2_PELCU|nr:CAS1 domain-containing 1 isoform X1 [Pelobates cultripes]